MKYSIKQVAASLLSVTEKHGSHDQSTHGRGGGGGAGSEDDRTSGLVRSGKPRPGSEEDRTSGMPKTRRARPGSEDDRTSGLRTSPKVGAVVRGGRKGEKYSWVQGKEYRTNIETRVERLNRKPLDQLRVRANQLGVQSRFETAVARARGIRKKSDGAEVIAEFEAANGLLSDSGIDVSR